MIRNITVTNKAPVYCVPERGLFLLILAFFLQVGKHLAKALA
jgi:hypothetical protein